MAVGQQLCTERRSCGVRKDQTKLAPLHTQAGALSVSQSPMPKPVDDEVEGGRFLVGTQSEE
jgi:hypothetical protein